jgi:hypothetical protein
MYENNDTRLSLPGWAVITGASGGLGTSFALACARRNYNLLLIDLPQKNLYSLCDFLKRNFPIQTKCMGVDLAEIGFEKRILQVIDREKIQVNLLINNAGIGQNEIFDDLNDEYMTRMIEVNDIACVMLTKALLPVLKKNRKSFIINVSNLGGFYPLPRKTVYAASKGFIRQFSQALRLEEKKFGVNVSIVCPATMCTNINNYILHRQLNWFTRMMILHPRVVAEKALKDALRGKEIIIPGRLNRVLRFFLKFIPWSIQKRMAVSSMRQLEKKQESPEKVMNQEGLRKTGSVSV